MSANETVVTETAKPKTAKTTTITLTANGTTMRIRARRRRDGTAETFVTTTDAAKKTERGMTETHPTFDAAKASIAASATKAEKLGWTRKVVGRSFVAKPDAFSALPAPPKKGNFTNLIVMMNGSVKSQDTGNRSRSLLWATTPEWRRDDEGRASMPTMMAWKALFLADVNGNETTADAHVKDVIAFIASLQAK